MDRLRRTATRVLQAAFAARGRRLCPRRVLFLHIPKTAGSSVTGYFKDRLGTSWRGQAITVTDAALADPAVLALARRARFVGGHYGADALAVLGAGGDAFAFTVLRDPLDRLVSAWRFFQTHRREDLRLPFQRLEDALRSDHPAVRAAFADVMTHQLAGAGGPGAAPPVDRALATLARLDCVAMQDSLDADFAAILGRLGLPVPEVPARRNVTDDPERRGRARDRAMPPLPPRDEIASLAAPWIAGDSELVSRWAARAESPEAEVPPPG